MILAHCAISDLVVAVARAARPPEPLHRHRVVGARRRARDVRARARRATSCGRATRPTAGRSLGATQTLRMRAPGRARRPTSCAASWAGRWSACSAGEPRLELGPPPGAPQQALDPLLERVVTHLTTVMGRAFVRADFSEPLALARLACAVGDDAPQAEVCAAVLELLDLFDEHLAPPEDGRPIPAAARLLVFALIVARTPDVPLPGAARRSAPDASGGRAARAAGWGRG